MKKFIKSNRQTIYTVFFNIESGEMPQDFETYTDAKAYAEEIIKYGLADSYTIEGA